MKRFILVLTLAIVAAVSANAQVKYKELKSEYSYKNYIAQDEDPYKPGWAGAVSFFVPGASQLVMGETVRGLLFLGGNLVLSTIASDSYQNLVNLLAVDAEGKAYFTDEDAAAGQMLILLASGLASLGVSIWSSIDASHVAKVKNQYYQNLHVAPKISLEPMQNGALKPAAGLSLSYNF